MAKVGLHWDLYDICILVSGLDEVFDKGFILKRPLCILLKESLLHHCPRLSTDRRHTDFDWVKDDHTFTVAVETFPHEKKIVTAS